ncbi:hypothetical protein QE152_g30089 [Popillia japonica]|uniref:Uncharacterized protein n=1 Tax=Popillia japonica TaxID=7064 RepID=A0AAW1JG03_POPJA
MFTDRHNPFREWVVNRSVFINIIILKIYYKKINTRLNKYLFICISNEPQKRFLGVSYFAGHTYIEEMLQYIQEL